MCTKEDVKQLLEENNLLRDKNLDKKLLQLKEELFSHTSKLLQHQSTSPQTKDELNKITNCYSLQGAKLTNMEEQLAGIEKILDENKTEHKEIVEEGRKQHQETMDKLDEMSKTKADQVYVTKLETNLNAKAEKDSLSKLEKLTYWVLAVSVTSLVSFLITVIWFLLSRLLDK